MIYRGFSCARCRKMPPLDAVTGLRRFMRSAPTKMDLDGICVGTMNEQLCQVGIKKATDAAATFAAICKKNGHEVSLVVASPLNRAIATGRIFSTRLGAPLTTESLLIERNLGEAEGQPLLTCYEIPLFRHWGAPKGAVPQRKFEEGSISFLNELCTSSSRFGNYNDILFVTHHLRILTLIKIIKRWGINKLSKYTPPERCEVKTFGIGRPCERCGSHFYEPPN